MINIVVILEWKVKNTYSNSKKKKTNWNSMIPSNNFKDTEDLKEISNIIKSNKGKFKTVISTNLNYKKERDFSLFLSPDS